MEEFKNALRTLTIEVCRQLQGQEVPTRPVWTVVGPPDSSPYVALDADRPALSDVRFALTVGLLKLSEYSAAAAAVETEPGLAEGIIIDAGGYLQTPEHTNLTRALMTNFLWRYLREGTEFDWNETRFDEAFDELKTELRNKTVVSHTTLPLSNLKMEIALLEFGDELKLEPASKEELERWLNRNQELGPIAAGPPIWNTHYVDKPAVLHARQVVVGRPPPADLRLGEVPRVNAEQAVSALRLVMNAPISVLFQEQESEGLMALGGGGTSWGSPSSMFGPVVTLNQEKAAEVHHIWEILRISPNIGYARLPLRRWESSLLRASLEDRLIDTWIGLEALLLGVQEGELSYRAAVRLAEFLGTTGPDRKSIYDRTRDSYTWRSAIVHGSSSKKLAKRVPLQDAVQSTAEYLRRALLKVLVLPGPFDPSKLEADLLKRDPGSA